MTGILNHVFRENVGLLGLTRVGSRRVIQISSGFMILFSILGWYYLFELDFGMCNEKYFLIVFLLISYAFVLRTQITCQLPSENLFSAYLFRLELESLHFSLSRIINSCILSSIGI